MPVYEFRCEKCGETFTRVMSVKEREETKVVCPKCNEDKVKPVLSPFYAVTSKKS